MCAKDRCHAVGRRDYCGDAELRGQVQGRDIGRSSAEIAQQLDDLGILQHVGSAPARAPTTAPSPMNTSAHPSAPPRWSLVASPKGEAEQPARAIRARTVRQHPRSKVTALQHGEGDTSADGHEGCADSDHPPAVGGKCIRPLAPGKRRHPPEPGGGRRAGVGDGPHPKRHGNDRCRQPRAPTTGARDLGGQCAEADEREAHGRPIRTPRRSTRPDLRQPRCTRSPLRRMS